MIYDSSRGRVRPVAEKSQKGWSCFLDATASGAAAGTAQHTPFGGGDHCVMEETK